MRRKPLVSIIVGAVLLIAAPAAVASSTYATSVLANPSLVSFWRLNEQAAQTDTEGMTLADAKGANPGAYHLGVALGAQGSLAGDSATAAQFGVPDGYAQIAYAPSLNSPAFTIEGWVNFDVLADYMVVLGNGAQLSDNSGYSVQTYDSFGQPSLDLWMGTGMSKTMLRGLDYSPGQWIYFAGTYDGSTARWYENGQLVSSATTSYAPNASLADVVGLNPVNTGAGQLAGSVDDLAVYNSALSATTIQQHYQLGISDGTPPSTSLQSGPPSLTNQTSASFSFASNSVDPTYQCRLDGGAWMGCSSPYQLSGLGNGQHQVAVRAVNRAGQVDPNPPTATWTIDTTPPVTSFASGPPASTNSTNTTVSFTSKPGSSYLCQLDNGPTLPCSSPYSLTPVPDGIHMLKVLAIDPAGNVETSPATYTWTVDTAAPSTFILHGPTTQQPNLPFQFSSNKAGVSFTCEVDAGTWHTCSSPFTRTPETPGMHTFRVRAIDSLGNVDPNPASYTWTVFRTPSLQLRVTFPHQIAKAKGPTARFRWRASEGARLTLTVLGQHGNVVARTRIVLRKLAGAGVLPTALIRRLAPGRYTALLQAKAGNLSSPTVRVIFTVKR